MLGSFWCVVQFLAFILFFATPQLPAAEVRARPAVRVAGDPLLRLHPENPRYFLWRGRATVLVASGEHYGSVMNQDFDYRKYLITIETAGLNHTRIFLGDYVERAGAFGIVDDTIAPAPGRLLVPWARSGTPGYAGGGNKFDLDRWDPAYFERLHGFSRKPQDEGSSLRWSSFSSARAGPTARSTQRTTSMPRLKSTPNNI